MFRHSISPCSQLSLLRQASFFFEKKSSEEGGEKDMKWHLSILTGTTDIFFLSLLFWRIDVQGKYENGTYMLENPYISMYIGQFTNMYVFYLIMISILFICLICLESTFMTYVSKNSHIYMYFLYM